jgi:hypothetical protein
MRTRSSGSSLKDADKAKEEARRHFKDDPDIVEIRPIKSSIGGYSLKVDLRRVPDQPVPHSFLGVLTVIGVVGDTVTRDDEG